MTTTRSALETIATTLSERTDRGDPRSRNDLELAVLVLEDLTDEVDGYPVGSTTTRYGAPYDDPTVVLLRRLANAHHRLGVADRRGELTGAVGARLVALAGRIVPEPAGDGLEVGFLEPAVACC